MLALPVRLHASTEKLMVKQGNYLLIAVALRIRDGRQFSLDVGARKGCARARAQRFQTTQDITGQTTDRRILIMDHRLDQADMPLIPGIPQRKQRS